jgi:hypothetical protein
MNKKFITYLRRNWIDLLIISIFLTVVLVPIFPFVKAMYAFFFGDGLSWFAPWTFEYVQEYYIGHLPEDAANVEYSNRNTDLYASVSFSASPVSTNQFVTQFCYGKLYAGYDPFNAIDAPDAETSILIRTEENHFYYSHSPNIPSTVFGNRCYDSEQGGIIQIRIDQTNADLYQVRLDISGYCNLRTPPRPCGGQVIEYEDGGYLVVGDEPLILQPQRGTGISWRVEVERHGFYELQITPRNRAIDARDQIQTITFPTLHADELMLCSYCHSSKAGVIERDGFSFPFGGSTNLEANLQLFWETDSEQEYEVSVIPSRYVPYEER